MQPPATLSRLRASLDRLVVGQEEAKKGLVLALLARRHVYLEGPPGCGKSHLAASFARLSGGRVWTFAFHRDVRAEDLLGDALLRRRAGARGAGERIHVDVEPGPLFDAELAVLEDLSRAPGEALGVLLRILGERRALKRRLRLETAIATAPLESADSHSDPLEPTQLDRFGVQVRMQGLVGSRRWGEANELMMRSLGGAGPGELEPVLSASDRSRLQRSAAAIEVPSAARRAYRQLLAELVGAASSPAETALLSDRALGETALALFRSHALWRGAERVGVEDLAALRLMVARRLSEGLQEKLDQLIDEASAETPTHLEVPADGGTAEGSRVVLLESRLDRNDAHAQPGATEMTAIPDEARERPEPLVASVDTLMRALAGRIERGWVDPESDPGGLPRGYQPLRRLDQILDADLVDALLLVEGRLPGAARVFRRKRRAAGGALVVLRDISASMAGPKSAWAARIVRGVIRAAGRHRIRVGYVEFDHRARAYPVGGRFLHRSYGMLVGLAESQRAIGQTNYEAPLRLALAELKGRTGRNRHLVMLTDGLPILGDPLVRRERALARRLGVHLHTVYLGEGECPSVLDDLSRETQGLRFRARACGERDLRLEERR